MLLAVAILATLALVNYLVGGKRFLYPPVVFCSIWAIDLTLLWLAGDFFFPVSVKTLAILVCGCTAFSLGGYLAGLLPLRLKPHTVAPSFNKSISWLLFAVALSGPFIYRWISSIATEGSNFLMSAYMAMVSVYEEGEQSIILGNMLTLASIVAMLAVYERVGHGKRAFFACLLAGILLTLTGGRGAFVTMVLSLIAIEWIRSGKLKAKLIVPVFAVLLIFVSALAILIGKGDASQDKSIADNATPVFQGLVTYAAGGIPAFSQVVEHPNIIAHNWQADRPILLMLEHLGFHPDIKPLHAQFLYVGPNALPQNVYTMYFAYIDFGWPLAMCFVCFFGFALTRIYRHALAGRKIATLLYGFFFAAMLLSSFSDSLFFMGLNFYSKLFLVSWCVYCLPVRYAQFRAFIHNSVEADLKPLSP